MSQGPAVTARIRVLIADDHPVVRQGLRTFLDVQEDMEVVAEAADGTAAIERAAALAPDVILLDLKMPGLDGVGVLGDLRSRGITARALILTSAAGADQVAPAMAAGAVQGRRFGSACARDQDRRGRQLCACSRGRRPAHRRARRPSGSAWRAGPDRAGTAGARTARAGQVES